ncbi:nucleotide disphospho-sugar-binding domain-containing protein [Streptomyces sp. NPDC087300]|uniref:nucleotide disphospho-sugar-binding domain-containing protein n=1 Tax=Streptomyces sp. NPDC087300 TaxID=3365780 RepID=UPI0038136BB0
MRVLFVVFPATAHTFPVVPLAWALQNAGHEVRVATHPDMTRPVTEAGLAAVPLGRGDDLDEIVAYSRDPALLDGLSGDLAADPKDCPDWGEKWFRLTRLFARLRPLLEDLAGTAVRWRPDLVLWDPFCLPAAVAARLSGAAHARLLWGQDTIGWLRGRSVRYRTDQHTAAAWPEPLEEVMQQLLEPYGLPYEEELLLGQWSIDPMPPGLRPSVASDHHYESMRWIPYSGGAQVPDWLHARPSRPRVCLTLGVGGRGRQLFRESGVPVSDVLAATEGLGVELVATLTPDQTEGAAIPDHVRVVDYLPLSQLLPGCAAVVHHGGEGTFSTAAALGVPQLIVPMPYWGERAAARYATERYAGLTLEPAEFSPEALREALGRLVSEPLFHNGAAVLRQELAALPGPADLVPVLTDLTRRHARTS